MKFGKRLRAFSLAAGPAASPALFLDYKLMKQQLRRAVAAQAAEIESAGRMSGLNGQFREARQKQKA